MKKIFYLSLLLFFINSCVKYESEIISRYQLEEFLNLDNWKSEMFFYSQGNNPIPFKIDKDNINSFNLFGDWTDDSESAFYDYASGNYNEKSFVKFDSDEIILKKSLYITEVSTYAPFNDYNITFHPFEYTIFSTDMDRKREWSETKNITIEYDQYDFSGTTINNFTETVLATFKYSYSEFEDGVTFKGVYNPDDYYYDAIQVAVTIEFNSDIAPSKFYNKYYFSKNLGLVGFRTNGKVFRVDY